MRDFDRDNIWQRQVRDAVLAPQFYGSYAADGRYVFIDKGRLALTLQKRFAVDTFVQGRDGAAIAIEEKIVRWKGYAYDSYALETHSCTVPGYESDGWMRYGCADFLLYAFMRPDRLVVHLIDFPSLQAWFWRRVDTFPEFRMANTSNKSAGRKTPIAAVRQAAECGEIAVWREREVFPDPSSELCRGLFVDLARPRMAPAALGHAAGVAQYSLFPGQRPGT